MTSPLYQLDILHITATFLSTREFARAIPRCCRAWRKMSAAPRFWRILDFSGCPVLPTIYDDVMSVVRRAGSQLRFLDMGDIVLDDDSKFLQLIRSALDRS